MQWFDLPAPPGLPGLYGRAALRRRVTGRRLPEFGLRCPVRVDPARLARYRQLCGFAERALLPATYPHVLAFALQLKLLTDPAFPFPLLGLVHLENRIRVIRPLGGLGPFVIGVRVQQLQPHEKGVQFSLITRLEDQLGLLWEADSRLLCRALQLNAAPPERRDEQPMPLSPLAHWNAPRSIGRAYARVSGDCNPIHLSALSARLFGFPRAIAHGLWNKAQALAALEERLPAAGFLLEARFQKPVLLPSALTLLASNTRDSGQFSLQGADQTPHMRGSWQLV